MSADQFVMQRIGPVLLAATLALGACGSGDDDVTVSDAWARASAPTQTSGAVYFDLTVATDDDLVGASVPASIATAAEIHEVVMVDESTAGTDESDASDGSHDMDTDMGTDTGAGADDGGQMPMMQELSDGLALTGGETVSFEPGSYHVMLPELAGPLDVGEEFELTLEFANADDVTVTVEVAESAPRHVGSPLRASRSPWWRAEGDRRRRPIRPAPSQRRTPLRHRPTATGFPTSI